MKNSYIFACHIICMSNMLFSLLKDHVIAILDTSAVEHGPDSNMILLMTAVKK